MIFNTIPRLCNSVPRTGKVERPSVYTRNSSLPGRYSHRSRTLLERDEAPEVYKRLPDVLAEHAGSIRVKHTLRPLGVAMAGRDVHDPYKD